MEVLVVCHQGDYKRATRQQQLLTIAKTFLEVEYQGLQTMQSSFSTYIY